MVAVAGAGRGVPSAAAIVKVNCEFCAGRVPVVLVISFFTGIFSLSGTNVFLIVTLNVALPLSSVTAAPLKVTETLLSVLL